MQKSFTNFGFSASNAYFKVGRLQVSSRGTTRVVNFRVKAYFSESAKNSGTAPIETYHYNMQYSITSSAQDQYNIVKAAYEHLKTLSEFSGATDV